MSESSMSEPSGNGVLNLASSQPVDATTASVVKALQGAGLTIFAQIDQQAAAHDVGVAMQPMVLVIFGNPEVGTPLMQAYPSLAIDLPLKALVWEDAGGQVWVSTNDPGYLQKRHALRETPFAALLGPLRRALEPTTADR